MTPDGTHASTERTQTDDSLRAERDKADNPQGEGAGSLDGIADAVIGLARQRADSVLAAARAKMDRGPALSAPAPSAVAKERAREDSALAHERADADEVLRDERAEHGALLANERDETDKDLAFERDRADHSLATRDEFLGIVSHDLWNMLHSIIGFARLISDGGSDDEQQEKARGYARRIERSGARMTRLVGDLVDVASIEAGALAVAPETGDPKTVVDEVVETFQTQALANNVSLTADISEAPARAYFDSARVLQVLANLVSNAIKFTSSGGAVLVRLTTVGEHICFSVSDTGVGIAQANLEAIFERFLQLDKGDRRGVGLGLYISKCIVQGHGGRIWAESTLGVGSTFRFTLPKLS